MKIFYSFFLLLLFFGERTLAQSSVTFADQVNTSNPVDFAVGDVASGDPDPTHYVPIPTSTTNLKYQFTLYKTKGSTSKGYVSIFTSTTRSNLNQPELLKVNIPNTGWIPVYLSNGGVSNEESIKFNGTLSLSSTQVGSNTGIYAVYVNTLAMPEQQVEVTPAVRLGSQQSPPPTYGTTPQIYSVTPTHGLAGTTVTVDVASNVSPGGNGNYGYVYTFRIGSIRHQSSLGAVSPGVYRLTFKIPGGASGNYLMSIDVSDYRGPLNTYVSPIYFNVDPRQITDFIPCGNVEICSDQCISYNETPQIIKGRILADDNSDIFQTYSNFVSTNNQPAFANGSEFEKVQWQYSYDQSNWTDISGANNADYQSTALTRTTYYRRSSTHQQTHWYGGTFQDHWYDSNIITINVAPPASTSTQPSYSSCGSGNTLVTLNPTPNATSYEWWLPYTDWGVSDDGGNPFLTYNNGRNFVTTSNKVFITLPNGVPAGDYPIYTYANGNCGIHSSVTTVYIHVTPGGTPVGQPVGYTLVRNGTGCNTSFNVTTPQVSNANTSSYELKLIDDGYTIPGYLNPDGKIQFDSYLPPMYSGLASITATGACNSATYSFRISTPVVKGCANIVASPPLATSMTLYPNPTTEQITLVNVGHEATATFYDTQGVLRKTVILKAQDVQTSINVKDLIPGLYHIRVTAEGKSLFEKQLLIQQ